VNPALNVDPETSQLATYGWLMWDEATHLLGGADAAWLAPSGIARRFGGTWPTRMPLTTRIHAWDEASSLQWRLVPRPTCGTVLVTCLSRDGTALPGAPRTRQVTASVQPGREWDRTWIRESAAVMFLRPARSRIGDQPR
jgi:hypothetical protein